MRSGSTGIAEEIVQVIRGGYPQESTWYPHQQSILKTVCELWEGIVQQETVILLK